MSDTPQPSVLRRRALGRGLDALLGGQPGGDSAPSRLRDMQEEAALSEGGDRLVEVNPANVDANPEQPRQQFDQDALSALAESMRLHGLLHPIVVERVGTRYRLVAGERRLRASLLAGLATVPAIVRPAAESAREALEMALTENLLRTDLSPIEEASAYARLADVFGLSHEAVAARLGRSRPSVTNTIRLLGLPAPVQQAIAAGRLSAGHGRAILALPEGTVREEMGATIEARGLTVREAERAIQKCLDDSPQAGPPASNALAPDDEALRRGFEAALGTPVHLQRRRRGGRLIVEFHSDDDLGQLYERLGGPEL